MGLIADHKCLMLLDSGASNNFVGLPTCLKLGLKLHARKSSMEVKLANGKIL